MLWSEDMPRGRDAQKKRRVGVIKTALIRAWATFLGQWQVMRRNEAGKRGLRRDGAIVSSCISCRENAFMAEAFVKTMPSYRGCGYGARVTLAWAREVHRDGRTPVFSCRGDNLGSLGIASRLGLTLQFRELRLIAET